MADKRDIVISAVKLVNAGHKMDKGLECAPGKSSGDKVYYPSLYLEGEEAKQFNGFDVGSSVKMVIEAEIKSKTLRERGNEKKTEVSIDIKKVGVVK